MNNNNNGRVKKIEAIWTDLHIAGNGKDILMRRVVQIFDLEGNVMAENDQLSFNVEQLKEALNKLGAPEEQLGQILTAMGIMI